MKILTPIILTLICSFSLMAQEGKMFQDVLYLKDGSIFRGEILDYKADKSVTLRTWSGQEIEFAGANVKKVRQEVLETQKSKKVNSYQFKEKGYFNSTDLSINGAEGNWGRIMVGAGIANVTGYQFNRWIGAGIGVGFDTYRLISNEQFIPVFAEARGYLLKKTVSPMYRYQIGYGFGLKDLEQDLFKSEGGIYSYPAIGIRFGANSGGNVTMDIGYKLQLSTQHYRVWEGVEVRSITYNRFTLRCGVQF